MFPADGPADDPRDNRPQSDAQRGGGAASKPSQHPLEEDVAKAGQQGYSRAAATRVAFGQRAVSAHSRPRGASDDAGPSAGPRAPVMFGNNGRQSGLERAMLEFRAASRANAPAQAAAGHAVTSGPSRRAFSDTAQVAAPASRGPSEEELSRIRDIIEEAVEQQVAAALAPLRLVVNQLNSAIQSAGQETADLREQNDVLSRQIDLHYRDIQQHSQIASTNIRALTNLVGAHSQINQMANENLAATSNLVSHLSQVVASLPQSLAHIVQNIVAQEVQSTLGRVSAAEQEAMDKVQAFLSSQLASFESRQGSAAPQQQQQQQIQGGAAMQATRPISCHGALGKSIRNAPSSL